MIPKIIHYTWFSGEPFPAKIQKCIDSWHEYAPDYDIRLWDMAATQEIGSEFVNEAISVRKWAYAADYVRLYALYKYGGIYIDTDAMLLRPIDEFLENRAFIGKENSLHFTGDRSAQYLSSHFMGAEMGHPFIKDCLDYYDGRHFIHSSNQKLPAPLRYNFVLLPYIQAEIARLYGFDWRPLAQTIQHCQEGLTIYPTVYFDATTLTEYSTCRHLALGSWREEKKREYDYTVFYKLRWRFLYVFQWVLRKFNYITVELE